VAKKVLIFKYLAVGDEKSCHRMDRDQVEEVRMIPVGDEEWVEAAD
jgi:hypothetical protein